MLGLTLALLLAAPSPAPPVRAEPAPSVRAERAKRVEATADLDGDRIPDRARLERRGQSLFVVVDKSTGGTAERLIGDDELPFQLDGRESRLTVKDVTGDGRPEVIVAATAADRGFLYVLRVEGASLESLYPDADAFVSETGSFPDALAIDSKGRVTIASLDHSEDEGPREALFTFVWSPTAKGYELATTKIDAEDD